MGWKALYELAVHGFVDLGMVRESGLTRDQARHRAATDGWSPDEGGGWRLPTHEDTPRYRLAAAVRQCGPDAVADRHSALALRGLVTAFPSRPQVLLPHEARSRALEAVDARRSRRLLASHVEQVDRIPCVSAARGIANLAGELRTPALRSLSLAAERDGHMRPGDLARLLDDLPPNWSGRGRLRQVVEDLVSDGSESGFEHIARQRMRGCGLHPDDQQPVVVVGSRRRRIDIAWVALRVGVECQGYTFHAGPAALDDDAGRLNALLGEADWIVLQLTPAMLHDGWEPFIADLRRCLARRALQMGIALPAGVTG